MFTSVTFWRGLALALFAFGSAHGFTLSVSEDGGHLIDLGGPRVVLQPGAYRLEVKSEGLFQDIDFLNYIYRDYEVYNFDGSFDYGVDDDGGSTDLNLSTPTPVNYYSEIFQVSETPPDKISYYSNGKIAQTESSMTVFQDLSVYGALSEPGGYGDLGAVTLTVSSVPEPSAWAIGMLGAALLGLQFRASRARPSRV